MTTDITIFNSALLLINAEDNAVSSFDTTSSREARMGKLIFNTTREKLLTTRPVGWTFARGYASLSRIEDVPLFDYDYAYQLPTDPKLLKLIGTEDRTNEHRVVGDKLYSNNSTVKIRYIYDPGAQNYPSYFVEALEYALAVKLALGLEADANLMQALKGEYRTALIDAKTIDAMNEPPKSFPESAFVLTSTRY